MRWEGEASVRKQKQGNDSLDVHDQLAETHTEPKQGCQQSLL